MPGARGPHGEPARRARLRLRRRLGALPRATAPSTWTTTACGTPGAAPRRSGGATSRRSARRARSGLFDILAHPDLVKVWGRERPLPDGDLRRYYELAIEAIAESGIAVEVSTAGLRKPRRRDLPRAGVPGDVRRSRRAGRALQRRPPSRGHRRRLRAARSSCSAQLGVARAVRLRAPPAAAGADRARARMSTLVGIGYDSHRLVAGRRLVLGGVEIAHELRPRRPLRRRRADARRDRRAARRRRARRHRRALPRHRRALARRRLDRAAARTSSRCCADAGCEIVNVDCTRGHGAPEARRQRERRSARGSPRRWARRAAREREGDAPARASASSAAARASRRSRSPACAAIASPERARARRRGRALGLRAMREIRLHDTRSGELQPLRAARSRRASASTPAGRPSTAASTSATRGRSSSSACSSASSSTRATSVEAGRQRHRRQRQDLRRRARAGSPSAELAAEMTAPTSPTPTRSGSAAPTTSRSRRRRSGRSSS